nr:LysR family transcriptional regulator [uncultured Holophaga sp.]
MDLRSLRAFVEVVRSGSFSEAAKVVFATQPTVSKAVRQLEDELGLQLLDRGGRRIRPTEAGDCVFRRALAMLGEQEGLRNDLSDLAGLRTGRLRLGLTRLGSSVDFARLLAGYRLRYPGVELELLERGALHLQEALREGTLDLALCMQPLPADLLWEPIYDEPLMALLPERHPLAGRESLRLAELAESPFILFEEGFALNPGILEACARAGFSPRVAAHSGQPDFLRALVAAGLGVAFLPRLICRDIAAPLRAIPVEDPQLRWRIVLAWQEGLSLSPAARAFLDMALGALRGA